MDCFNYPLDTETLLRKKRRLRKELLAQNPHPLQKRIAILGGSTTNEVADQLGLFLLQYGIQAEFYQSEYGQYWQDAMFGTPELDGFHPDVIYIHTNWRNIINFPTTATPQAEIDAMLNAEYSRFEQMWQALEAKFHCPVIQNNFDRPNYRLMGNRDIWDPHGRSNYLSRLNQRFYAYAAKEVARGYVREGDSFEALFPHLPANTAQMRGTELFVQAVYPVSVTDGSPTLHAWDGCPKAAGYTFRASLHDMEAGAWETCSECGFTAASLGKVAAASTSIGNGFEHHYEQVALAAEDYQKALEEGAPAKREAKSRVSKLLDQLRDACSSVGSFRIDADPPGGKGVVCLAVNTGPDAPDKGFESAFVQASGQLGCRVAISAATLVADSSGEGRSVIASLTDGLASDSALAGVLGAAVGVWSGALSAYADGQSALDAAVREGLGGLPLVSASGLGDLSLIHI